MNLKPYIAFAVVVICLMLMVSCKTSVEASPVLVDERYLNKQILLRAPSYSNTFKTEDQISLELKYNSSDEIVFPNNYNLRIFERTSDTWVEIKERPRERYPLGDVVFSATKYMPPVQVIFLMPDLTSLGQKHQLRIYVFGNMKIGDDIVKAAAFTDVTLSP